MDDEKRGGRGPLPQRPSRPAPRPARPALRHPPPPPPREHAPSGRGNSRIAREEHAAPASESPGQAGEKTAGPLPQTPEDAAGFSAKQASAGGQPSALPRPAAPDAAAQEAAPPAMAQSAPAAGRATRPTPPPIVPPPPEGPPPAAQPENQARPAAESKPKAPPPPIEAIETLQYLSPPPPPPRERAPRRGDSRIAREEQAAPAREGPGKLEAAYGKLLEKRRREGLLLEGLAALFIALVLCIFLTQVVLVCAQVPSQSMADTIDAGDRLLGLRLAYVGSAPQRYDLIIFKFPDNEALLYVKRVIGLPGEEVEIREGLVYVNGEPQPLDSGFVKGEPAGNFGPYTVPGNMYFVLGDNRAESWDSRYWANTFVDKMKIVGRVVYRLYPNPGPVD